MFKVRRMSALVIGLLLSSAGIADDAASSKAVREQPPAVPVSIDALLAQPGYGARWQVAYPVVHTDDTGEWMRPVRKLNFKDSGTLSRFGHLRSLSLLTVAEIGRTQVFIGVDADGLVGVHFISFNRRNYKRHVELLRLSYLQDDEIKNALER